MHLNALVVVIVVTMLTAVVAPASAAAIERQIASVIDLRVTPD